MCLALLRMCYRCHANSQEPLPILAIAAGGRVRLQSKEGATLPAYRTCKHVRCMTLRRSFDSVFHVAMLMLSDSTCNAWYS